MGGLPGSANLPSALVLRLQCKAAAIDFWTRVIAAMATAEKKEQETQWKLHPVNVFHRDPCLGGLNE